MSGDGTTVLVAKIEIIPGTYSDLRANEYAFKTKVKFTESFTIFSPATTVLVAYSKSGTVKEIAGLSADFANNIPVKLTFGTDMKALGEKLAHEIMHGIILNTQDAHLLDLDEPGNLMNWQYSNSLPGERPLRYMKMTKNYYKEATIDDTNNNQWQNIKR
jgi:hypothetical protein